MKSGTITLIIDEKIIYEVSQPEVVFDVNQSQENIH